MAASDLDVSIPFLFKQTGSNTVLISGGNLPAGSVLAIKKALASTTAMIANNEND